MTRILTVLLIGLALLVGGCNDDEISSLPEASGAPPLFIKTFSGGSIQMTGTWGGCDNDGTNSHKTTIIFNGGRADVVDQDFLGNLDCSSAGSPPQFQTITFGNEGSVLVDWDPSPPGPPPGAPDPIMATRVLVNFPDGSFSKGVSVINTAPTPPPPPIPPPEMIWFRTWDDEGYPLDGAGYPTIMSHMSRWATPPLP